ncbi:MAG TPA: nucleotidyltransferase domain-containing protein [Thermoanaerobaculia bacterium]|nr:nucleotidyltransferase domain-containing protein [Thermoanaerobaculia bacterium]
MSAHLQLDREVIADFCRRNHIRRLSLFGSVLTDRFRPDSDVDVLVEFDRDAQVGYLGMAGMEIELGELLGRRVDLRTPAELSRSFRQDVVGNAEVQYSAD